MALLLPIAVAFVALLLAQNVGAQYRAPAITRPYAEPLLPLPAIDSIMLPFPVQQTVPQTYEELMGEEFAADLSTPANIRTVVEYDPDTGCYIIRTKLGETDIATPFLLSQQQYNDWQTRQTMLNYYRQRNALLSKGEEKQPFNVLNMNFALGPLEKIFGPGGVQLKTQGSVQVNMGIKSNKTDNPALSLSARRKTYFDFDQKIQATINASVGDRMHFDMTYNTDATFDFDSKNLKLQYEGTEDDIVKSIEAGNVSLTTGSSLIRGSTALFGIKTKLQFGRLTATALVSQQNSQSQSISTKGGAQTTEFSVNADEYDQNRHFFLAHFFRDNYDRFAAKLPYVSSGINITKIEVWVTNKTSTYNQSRNLVAFMDLGENSHLANNYWMPDMGVPVPCNASNNLLSVIKNDYPEARYINQVTQALAPLEAFGIDGGIDFEKVESARLLTSSEYTLNSTLGYISLKSQLNSDEVLAVAYQYTYGGQVYQVGEFSSDVTTTSQSLYLKMLKSTTISTKLPLWHLMMKNVYSIGAYQLQKSNFRLNIKYLSDTTGTEISYLPVPNISDKTLLQVMNLDRLDSNQESNSDGFFDYIEGYTVQASTGRIIFPVVEPFGKHLERVIGDPATARQYVYQELYDSTLVVARQFADKNKFVLRGEYQASSGGSQIRLNAMNVPRGSVVVTAGGVVLTENSDYTVDYSMGIVTITNQSIIDSGQSINVTLENQSLFSTQRKTLLGLDLNYAFSPNFNVGATLLRYSEKALVEKVNIGEEVVNNTMLGFNFSYNTEMMWLTHLLNKIPTVDAVAPSRLSLQGEWAKLIPQQQRSGSNKGSSYLDDFESTQSEIDLRSPYSWNLASTPYDGGPGALFPEAALSNNVDYGKNRALLNWYYIDRLFTQRNSSMAPGYIKSDLKQQSNPYVREITSREIFPDRQLSYGESSTIQTLNLSFYPTERGPYNLDATNIDDEGQLLYPEKRWGGIMRRLDNTDFESANIEYLQFWLLNPFLDPENPNYEGGDLYFNFGEISEDILKDGLKSYENGIPFDGNNSTLQSTVWGRVSSQNSLNYAFDNNNSARLVQDVGIDGLPNDMEYTHPSYQEFLEKLTRQLHPATVERMKSERFSPFNDPASDNYHFYRGRDYDEERLSILERYKRYNGVEGNSLSPEDAGEPLYQSARSGPDVEDINQDNTLNEYERYFQYRVSIRPADLEVGRNYITDKQVSLVSTRDGSEQQVEWYQFKIPLDDYEKVVGNINDLSSVRFMRMFMTGFKSVTHLRFATLELVRGEWRVYDYNLNTRGDAPAEGQIDMSVVNIEENSGRTPVNYVLPPGVTRISDPSQSQIVQLNEQSMSMRITGLQAGDARAAYRNMSQDLRNYRRMQMWVHAEAFIDDVTALRSGDCSVFIRLGSDVKNNFYEYEVPLTLTPPGRYSDSSTDRYIVWPKDNYFDFDLQTLVNLKKERNVAKQNDPSGVGFATLFTGRDPDNERNRIAVKGNPSLSDVRVMMVGVRNNASTSRDITVWVNELKVTDFASEGGWAAKGNANLTLSDIGTVNVGAHVETAGFGGVDQALNSRRMDDYHRYNFAVQIDVGRFLPAGAKLRAPVYYSVSKETTTPLYNPLDQDVKLKDALDDAATQHDRDSIESFAVERTKVENFSISGLNFGVKSDTPKPWDPANFTLNFSFSKRTRNNPTMEYEYTNDYRGSLQYTYTQLVKGWRPFQNRIESRNRDLKFFREWELNWLPTSISFLSTISRYYFEQQMRSEADANFNLPVSVSKNFLWDRQLNITWNITKSLNLNFTSNTSARIEEPIGAVNRRLFPDKYREWRDTVMQSILHMGTPWNYNQTFSGQYKAPFNRIPWVDFLTGSVGYNATYTWARGATIEGVNVGNTITNQATWNADGRFNFETLYNKIPYLKEVNSRFASSRRQSSTTRGSRRQRTTTPKARRFEKTEMLSADTTTLVTHNLKTKNVKVTARDASTDLVHPITTRVVDENTIEVLDHGTDNLKITVVEVIKRRNAVLKDIGAYATRLAMSPRSFSMRWRKVHSLSLPLFQPSVGNIFGQSNSYGPMSPGLDFAFGFAGEGYVQKSLDRGWLITDDGQTSPAIFSRTSEVSFELNLEPLRGLKIQLTLNRTDNRSQQMQFMYDGMPTTMSGSFTMTHCAIGTALRGSKASNGYENQAFTNFLEYIPVVAQRIENGYQGINYPTTGFMKGLPMAGQPFNPELETISPTSSDVLIPAFMAAYSGKSPHSQWLDPFPGLGAALPNWRITYDGLIEIGSMRNIFKAFSLSHAYQCTYSVGSYSSFINWISADGTRGFTLNEATGLPMPSSPYNISSVAITERFAPLIGASATLHNDMSINAEFRDQRTLTLNSSAGQVVESTTRGITAGLGYKIVNFNSVLKMRGTQQGISHDLTINGDFSFQVNQALIRRIEEATSQATSGTRTIALNINANYVLSRRMTMGMFFEHQVNTPIVSSNAFPTTNTSFGMMFNLSLAR